MYIYIFTIYILTQTVYGQNSKKKHYSELDLTVKMLKLIKNYCGILFFFNFPEIFLKFSLKIDLKNLQRKLKKLVVHKRQVIIIWVWKSLFVRIYRSACLQLSGFHLSLFLSFFKICYMTFFIWIKFWSQSMYSYIIFLYPSLCYNISFLYT